MSFKDFLNKQIATEDSKPSKTVASPDDTTMDSEDDMDSEPGDVESPNTKPDESSESIEKLRDIFMKHGAEIKSVIAKASERLADDEHSADDLKAEFSKLLINSLDDSEEEDDNEVDMDNDGDNDDKTSK